MLRWLRGTAAATAASAVVLGALVVTTPGAGAGGAPGAGGAAGGGGFAGEADAAALAAPGGCSAQDFLGGDDVLRPGRALCNGNYLLRMQPNGDLVLREVSTGRACWHSATFVAGASTTFEPGWISRPINKKPVLKIGDHQIVGENDEGLVTHDGTSANLTADGEFYIGYLKQAAC